MTARTVIDAVMVEVALDVANVTYEVGHAECDALSTWPRVEWRPLDGTFVGPQQSGHNPRPLQNRWVQYAVACKGRGHDEAEALLEAVIRGLHLTLTIGGYRVAGETWARPGASEDGDTVTLSAALGLPVLDRVQPTVGEPSPGLFVSGGFE